MRLNLTEQLVPFGPSHTPLHFPSLEGNVDARFEDHRMHALFCKPCKGDMPITRIVSAKEKFPKTKSQQNPNDQIPNSKLFCDCRVVPPIDRRNSSLCGLFEFWRLRD